jgi:hypothetical protein
MKARTHDPLKLTDGENSVIAKYVALLEQVVGPVRVWVTTDEGLLHFYTLIPRGRENLNAVIDAEYALLGMVDPLTVDFDIYEDAEVASLVFSQQAPVFHRS